MPLELEKQCDEAVTEVPGDCRGGAVLKETRGLLVTSPEVESRGLGGGQSPHFLPSDLQPVLEAQKTKEPGKCSSRDKELSWRRANREMIGPPSFQTLHAGRSQCASVFSPLCPSLALMKGFRMLYL